MSARFQAAAAQNESQPNSGHPAGFPEGQILAV
jgi:hypothetical protein